jgi:Fe-S cluster assembly protein SufB
VETGSAITWKYPSVILQGDNSTGEFYSVAVVNNRQQADTGTKMIHIGRNTKSNIVSKGISAGHGQNSYRGQVKVMPKATGARNYTQCDSMLVGNQCGAHTFPYIEVGNNSAQVEHEASTSKIGEDQIFYLKQRGLSAEQAVSMIVSGFCKEVFKELPMEFALEAQQLLGDHAGRIRRLTSRPASPAKRSSVDGFSVHGSLGKPVRPEVGRQTVNRQTEKHFLASITSCSK